MTELFRPLDVLVILLYLGGMAWLGFYFSKKNKSTEDYFLGARSFPGWAIGLSLMGTSISSITFLALPAGAYSLDWRMIVPNLTLPIVAVFAILLFIPIFRRGRAVSAFEYLELRYGPVARVYGAISFLILQLMRIGIVMYLVSMPLEVLTGIPQTALIVVGGIFIVLYTLLGGIEAVIWTDVVQSIVLILGGILCFSIIVFSVPGGLSEILSTANEADKLSLGEFDWDWGERTFFTMIITGVFGWVGMYTADQNVVQRYLAASSTREARKAVLIAAAMSVPTWAFFFFIGTCLFVFFVAFPSEVVAGMEPDQVFPYFIMKYVPQGLSGLIISGILAAAMSSLDSSLNSIATVTTNDLLRRHLLKGRDDSLYLKLAKWVVLVAGAFMVLFALFMARTEQESVMDVNLVVAAIFGGALSGMYLVGFFVTRVGNREMLAALAAAIVVNVYLVLLQLDKIPEALALSVHAYWAGLIVNGVFVVVAVVLSIFRRNTDRHAGLTVWTINEPE